MYKHRSGYTALILFLSLLFSGSAVSTATNPLIRLATTTSTANSGLLDYLIPKFKDDTAFPVQYIAVGTGKALRLGQNGDVDIVLVHAKPAEERFIEAGHGVKRVDIMYNDFVLVGPAADAAHIRNSSSVIEALNKIHQSNSGFVSRGDDSGTHKKELFLWQLANQKPGGEWYKAVGQGMGKTIQIANELQAYTLTDRGTWLAYQDKVELTLLYQGDPPLNNPYGIIAVNPNRHDHVNYTGAVRFISWLTSAKGQRLIGEFKVHGEQLFIPSAKP